MEACAHSDTDGNNADDLGVIVHGGATGVIGKADADWYHDCDCTVEDSCLTPDRPGKPSSGESVLKQLVHMKGSAQQPFLSVSKKCKFQHGR